MHFSTLLLGPAGTGKSWFAASVAELGPTLLLVTNPQAAASQGYDHFGVTDRENYVDLGWVPSLKEFEAEAHMKLLRRLHGLLSDDKYEAIVLDDQKGLGNNVNHEILKHEGMASYGDFSDARSKYSQRLDSMKEIYQLLLGLVAAKRPKHVIMVGHTEPIKEGDPKTGKPSADQRGQGVEYEGDVLPLEVGQWRRHCQADFGAMLFSKIEIEKLTKTVKVPGGPSLQSPTGEERPRWLIQVQPDEERHAKINIGYTPDVKYVDNNFKALLEAIHKTPKAVAK